MRCLLKRALPSLMLLSFVFITQSADPKEFPNVLQNNKLSYKTEVTLSNEDENITIFATEYYDETELATGRVDLVVFGQELSIIYYNETNQIIHFTPSACDVWDTEESIYDYQPLFYGWLYKNPLIIGPTAPLWMAQNDKGNVTYIEGDFVVRNINCDKFTYDINGPRDHVTFTYYFATDDWSTPYNVEGIKVPIRIEVRGNSSKYSEKADQWESINYDTDFSYFRPDLKDYNIFEPPEGIGCRFKKDPSGKIMPEMPKKYKYTAEVIDLLQDSSVTYNNYQQVWYDSVEKLARLDKYTKMRYVSELYDFKSGVTYANVDGQTCDIKPLRNSFFEGYDGQMIGHLKEPGEVLGLDDSFYPLGKKLIRSIWCDVFETKKENVTFMGQSLAQLVITVYYSSEFYEVNVGGETEVRVPVFYAVKGWAIDEDNKKAGPKLVINLHYNIFAFDDAIYPDMYSSFRLGRCFPSVEDKSYFILVFSVSDQMAAKMESEDSYIMEQLRARIMTHAKVSNIRIPMLRADYKTTGVYVTGLMLNRPPALKQFWLEFEGDRSTNDPNLKVAPAANTKEKCALACVDEGFECFGFFFCNEACFLKFKDILEPDDGKGDYNFGGTCQEWLRAEKESKNEPYLKEALKNLEDAVLNNLVSVTVTVDEGTTSVPVEDIVIGDGPYTGLDDQDKPYELVIKFAKLDPEDETTEQMSYIDNLNDCYRSCKTSEDIDCSSFSYCPDSDNKQCSISSVLVVDRKHNPDDTVDDKNCYVYSMRYIDHFDAYPGRVSLIPGADVFYNVKTVEDCARRCRLAKDINCRGFDYCRHTQSCVLRTKHVLDLTSSEVVIDKKASCIHYAVRYAADYLDMGHVLIDDSSDVRTELSLEECSKVCSEELKDRCQSFNYCPKSGPYMTDSKCELSTLSLTSDSNKQGKSRPPCHHFEKKKKIDDWGRTPKNSLVTSGYTKGGFAGLVVGMLILGLTLGALGFVAYSYYRSRSSADGMTVRFTKGQI